MTLTDTASSIAATSCCLLLLDVSGQTSGSRVLICSTSNLTAAATVTHFIMLTEYQEDGQICN